MLLSILMLLGLLGGVWLWNTFRAANSELHRVNREIIDEFGTEFATRCCFRGDFLQPWLTPTLLAGLLAFAICVQFALMPRQSSAEPLAAQVAYVTAPLEVSAAGPPPELVSVPDTTFPPVADCVPLPLDYTRELARRAGRLEGVEPGLLLAVVYRESRFSPCAVSASGARGLMQLKPATARDHGVTDLFDPGENLIGGARYLRFLMDRYGGDISLALSAYLTGPGSVDRALDRKARPAELEYVQSIMDLAGVLADD